MSHPPSDVIHACAIAGETCIPYRRSGRGQPVFVLAGDDALTAALLHEPPAGFSIIAPEFSSPVVASDDRSAWIETLLDALGMERVSIVAHDPLVAPARALAMTAPDRVARVLSSADHPTPLAIAKALMRGVD